MTTGATIKLIEGVCYDTNHMRCVGWTKGDGSGHDGYNWRDYFDDHGTYAGPDQHGIEPHCETTIAND